MQPQDSAADPTAFGIPADVIAGFEELCHFDSGSRACHQHEIDQLDGIFWIQKLSALKRDQAIRRYQKLRRLG